MSQSLMRPARPSDLPDILTINAAALATHTQAQFCHPFRESHPEAYLRVFQHQARKKALLEPDGVNFNVVIEDSESGKVVAWAYWRRLQGTALESKLEKSRKEIQQTSSNFTTTDTTQSHNDPSIRNSESNESTEGGEWNSDNEESSPSASRSRVRLAHAFSAADNLLYFSTPHWYLSLLMVHPAHKRVGHATRLTLWGMQRAAADGIPCLLIASEQGEHVYTRLGWRMLGRRKFPGLEDMPDEERRREEEVLGKEVVREQFNVVGLSVMIWGDRDTDIEIFEKYKDIDMEGVV
ncbi:hypothetical protein ABW21_db0204593 [Orbilia brochopaga]|nr:hypothetical protein ABW21_db0204593 [Drechslerella brochopaga]